MFLIMFYLVYFLNIEILKIYQDSRIITLYTPHSCHHHPPP